MNEIHHMGHNWIYMMDGVDSYGWYLKIWMKVGMTLTLGLQINQEWVKGVGQDDVRLGKGKESTTRTQKEKIQLSTWIPTFGIKISQESWVFKFGGFQCKAFWYCIQNLLQLFQGLLVFQGHSYVYKPSKHCSRIPTQYVIFQALTISSFYCKYSTLITPHQI